MRRFNAWSIPIAMSLAMGAAPSAGADERTPQPILLAAATDVDPRARTAPPAPLEGKDDRRATGVRAEQPHPVWVPRTRRGAPAARTGGASRSAGQALVVLAWVPEIDEAALTLSAHPSLYWSLSAATPHAVNLTLVDPEAIDPILDVTLPGPFTAGVQVTALAEHGVELAIDERYEWFVAVVQDPGRRSADIIARGSVRRVADPELEGRVAGAGPAQAARVLAEEGIWYETLDAVSREASPADRSALLSQVGLEVESEAR
jgi:hypothetical protein